MNKNRREPVYDITSGGPHRIPKRSIDPEYTIDAEPAEKPSRPDRRPNYVLRRLGVGLTAAALAAIGVEVAPAVTHAISHVGEMPYDQHDCQPGTTFTLPGGETVWDDAGVPLANKLDIPVDEAMSILDTANPNIPSLGDVQEGTVINIPVCR